MLSDRKRRNVLTSLICLHPAEVQSLLLRWSIHVRQNSARYLPCFFVIWPVWKQKKKKMARGQIIAVCTAAATGSKVFTGCHKFPVTKQYIHNKPSYAFHLIFRRWAGDLPRVNINLTFHTKRKTMAKSGMKSKERRLRSTNSLRALGSWSAGEGNETIINIIVKKNKKKTQSAAYKS